MVKKGIGPFRVLLFVFLLLSFCFASCSAEETGAEAVREKPVSVKAADPGVGVGRIMPESADPKAFTICIDPGHGFMDNGTGEGYFQNGVYEKDVTLEIAKKLNEELISLGFDTIMTHDGITFPTPAEDDGNEKFKPEERISYANTLDIDYYISIHVNSYPQDTSVSGLRIYYEQNWRKENTYSETIAREIADAIYNEMPDAPEPILADQSVASYAVVRETKAAASLIEVGFCTNPTDAENMLNDKWQSRVAAGIANGLLNYYNEYVKGETDA